MGLYKNTNGVLSPIAGRGKAEYGASTVRKGTISFPATGSSYSSTATVTFDEPMPDNDYIVVFHPNGGNWEKRVMPSITAKTANGFTAVDWNINGQTSVNVTNFAYTAFKLYTDNEYNGLLNNQRYSTDEIDTGKTWIDGKNIYRKVVELSSQLNIQPNAGWTNMCAAPDGITNLIRCNVFQSGFSDWTAGAFYRYYQGYMQAYPVTATTMGITRIILEYTKTT